MIVKFAVTNYRGFADRIEWDLSTPANYEFNKNAIKDGIIKNGIIYGKPLLGKDGAFAPLLESILNAALEGEMDVHLTEEERQMGNRCNGKIECANRQLKTDLNLRSV